MVSACSPSTRPGVTPTTPDETHKDRWNIAGEGATVGGGSLNRAPFFYATVGGGIENLASGHEATIAGGFHNEASGRRAAIGGGAMNCATDLDTTVGGGSGNLASYRYATVSGGTHNTASSLYALVSGGVENLASSPFSAVFGGGNNQATGFGSLVSGGVGNTASGQYATIAGGFANQADGDYSFAGGQRAQVDPGHAGSFLFADSSGMPFSSQASNEFAVRSTGGVRLVTAVDQRGNPVAGVRLSAGGSDWEALSDESARIEFIPVDQRLILEQLAGLPIHSWSYKGQNPSIRHLGPSSQDFSSAFGLGEDDLYISSGDASAVALASIQGLYQILKDQENQIRLLQEERDFQQKQLTMLEARLVASQAQNHNTALFSTSLDPSQDWPWIIGLSLGMMALWKMKPRTTVNLSRFHILAGMIVLLGILAISGCTPKTEISAVPTATAIPTTTDRWFSLFLNTPYPWTTPLPAYRSSGVDGIYAKIDPSEVQWWHCRRCPDFLPGGGTWRLSLDKGIYRIYYQVTGWRSLGSFSISGNRIYLFNDPNCNTDTGVYKWTLKDGALTLELIEDPCAIGLRAVNLTLQPWISCQHPNQEAAISDHWSKPAGCVQ